MERASQTCFLRKKLQHTVVRGLRLKDHNSGMFSPVTLGSVSNLEMTFLELVPDVEWPVFHVLPRQAFWMLCVCVPIFRCIRHFTVDNCHKSKNKI